MDHPFDEIAFVVNHLASKGWECFQKFTCAKCGNRLTMEEPNILYETGTCDICGHLSNIKEQGCNYLAAGKSKSLHDLFEDQDEAGRAYRRRFVAALEELQRKGQEYDEE